MERGGGMLLVTSSPLLDLPLKMHEILHKTLKNLNFSLQYQSSSVRFAPYALWIKCTFTTYNTQLMHMFIFKEEGNQENLVTKILVARERTCTTSNKLNSNMLLMFAEIQICDPTLELNTSERQHHCGPKLQLYNTLSTDYTTVWFFTYICIAISTNNTNKMA